MAFYIAAIATDLGRALRSKEALVIILASILLIWFLVVRLIILRLKPLAVLRLSEKLATLDWKVPKLEITLPIRNILGVGLYRNHPRVLDAWVTEHSNEARRNFTANRTYTQRQVYFPLPVWLNGKQIPELTPKVLQNECARNRWCMLIRGEGGVGKTTLACQL